MSTEIKPTTKDLLQLDVIAAPITHPIATAASIEGSLWKKHNKNNDLAGPMIRLRLKDAPAHTDGRLVGVHGNAICLQSSDLSRTWHDASRFESLNVP